MKTYRCDSPEIYCRIGKCLLRIEFVKDVYATDSALIQRAIENSPHFKEGKITIVR
jgi:hypothetical protein